MSETTEKLILKAIAELQIETGRKKVPVAGVAKRAGISRQAIYSLYENFLPYISGQRPLEEVLDKKEFSEIKDHAGLQAEIASLKRTISDLEDQHQSEIEADRLKTSTTLMQRDIEIYDSTTTKSELHKKTIQLHNKINDLKKCWNTNAALEAKLLELKYKLQSVTSNTPGKMDKIIIYPDTSSTGPGSFRSELKNADKDAINQLIRSVTDNTTAVIVFINRFNCSYTEFVSHDSRDSGQYIYVSLTLPTARERKKVIKSLPANTHISAVIFETNQSNTNWYRRIHCQSIPINEFERLDKSWQPVLLSEGFYDVTYHREPPVNTQGERHDSDPT